MLNVLFKLLLYKSFYHIGFPKLLPMSYTISLTYECNSRCSTCNVRKKIENANPNRSKYKELNLEEYKKIFHSLGKSPFWVTFSGGEVFLRKDIIEIVNSFYDICQPKIINIPTNGILTHKIVKSIEAICQHCVKSQIIVNLSIDAIGEQHDQIRNFNGNYQKALLTLNKLKKISFRENPPPPLPHSKVKKYKNLSVGIHTVISKFNIDNFAKIANTLMELKPDQYITEIAEERNELETIGMDITPELIDYKAAMDFMIHRIKHTNIKKRMNRITQAFRIEYYKLSKAIIRYKKQVIPCYSGIVSCQISPEGDIWSCCVTGRSLGNLKKSKYNLKYIWKNKKFQNERKLVKDKKCHCPLANAAYTNMLLDFKTLYRVFYRSFIKWWN